MANDARMAEHAPRLTFVISGHLSVGCMAIGVGLLYRAPAMPASTQDKREKRGRLAQGCIFWWGRPEGGGGKRLRRRRKLNRKCQLLLRYS